MTSCHYHQTNLPANLHQLTYPWSLVNEVARCYPFLAWLIHYFFKKICLYILLKCTCFFFSQISFSILILGFLFCHVDDLFVQHLAHHVHVCLLSLLLLYITVKTFVIVLYIVILSVQVVVMFKVLVNLHSLLLVYLLVLQMSLNLLNSLPIDQLINLCISEKS